MLYGAEIGFGSGGVDPASFATLLSRIAAIRGTATKNSTPNNFTDAFYDQTGVVRTATQYTEVAYQQQNATISPGAADVRNIINGSLITSVGDRIKISFTSVNNGASAFTDCFIGYRANVGNAWDFEPSSVTRVTFDGGNYGKSMSAVNANYQSDEVKFFVDGTRDVIIAFQWSSGVTGRYNAALQTRRVYTKTGGVSSDVTPTGYSLSAEGEICFQALEISQSDDFEQYVSGAQYFKGVSTPKRATNNLVYTNYTNVLSGTTYRQIIPAADIKQYGNKIRVRVRGSYSTGVTYIDNCYIGEQAASGDPYDFATTPTRLTFFGFSNGVYINQNQEYCSDETAFTIQAGKNYIVSFDLATGTQTYSNNSTYPSGYVGYYKSGSGDAATVNTTGYSTVVSGYYVNVFQELLVSQGPNVVYDFQPYFNSSYSETGYSYRTVIPSSFLRYSGSKIRVAFQASTSGPMTITNAYFGHKGAGSMDFDGNQIQLLFGGSGSVTIPAGGMVFSDEMTFALDRTKDIVISQYSSGTNYQLESTVYPSGIIGAYKSGSDAATTTVTGYTTNNVRSFARLEITDPPKLTSINYTAGSQPVKANVAIVYQEIDATIENTETNVYLSRDNGTTWTQVIVADAGSYDGTYHYMIGTVDVSAQPAGTNVKIRVQTANGKEVRLAAWAVDWI